MEDNKSLEGQVTGKKGSHSTQDILTARHTPQQNGSTMMPLYVFQQNQTSRCGDRQVWNGGSGSKLWGYKYPTGSPHKLEYDSMSYLDSYSRTAIEYSAECPIASFELGLSSNEI